MKKSDIVVGGVYQGKGKLKYERKVKKIGSRYFPDDVFYEHLNGPYKGRGIWIKMTGFIRWAGERIG